MINVTKTYLPDRKKLAGYIDSIYERGWITNNGVLVQTLERRLAEFLNVSDVILVSNGTTALEVAYSVLELKGEVITSPFSFIATTSSLLMKNLKPVFADVDATTFNLDVQNIESLITNRTSAIVPVHVFGNPCDVDGIQSIAEAHNLRVIYDGAHAFGVDYKQQSVFNFGDISTVSFHATKIFHTIEGGALIVNNPELAHKIRCMINFGMHKGEIAYVGTNAKMNEFQAAMGLCILDDIKTIIENRKAIYDQYTANLSHILNFQSYNALATRNYGYFPVLFKNESALLDCKSILNNLNIFPRRYFYPSLDSLEITDSKQFCKRSRDIASRILCLPIFPDMRHHEQMQIIDTLRTYFEKSTAM